MIIRYRKDGKLWFAESERSENSLLNRTGAGFFFHWKDHRCYTKCRACAAGLGKFVWWTPYPERAAKLLEYCDEEAAEALRDFVEGVEDSRAAEVNGNGPERELPAPEGLDYYPFQRAGIHYWLRKKRVLLADEMGLGKTVQALGLMNGVPEIKRVLVVCPARLRVNWVREAQRWLVVPRRIHVVDKKRSVKRERAALADPATYYSQGPVAPADAEVVVVNYDRIRIGESFKPLMEREWDLLVVDEAHRAKNRRSAQQAKRVLGYWDKKAKKPVPGLVDRVPKDGYVGFLTGTPIPNGRPVELQPLAGALKPSEFGRFLRFARRYCAAQQGRWGWDFSGASNLAELQERLRGHIMVRRLKRQVLTELPPKLREVVALPVNGALGLVEEELERYEKHEAGIQAAMAEAFDAAEARNKEAYQAATMKLRALQQAAFEEMSRIRREVAVAKAPSVIEHVNEMLEATDEEGNWVVPKLLVFAHHHAVVDLFMEAWPNAARLDGRTSATQGEENQKRWREDPDVRVFVLAIMAAGEGLTFTEGHHVVFSELSWVPKDVNQAEDRAHRIGQEDKVFVQHLVFDGSLDARMAQTLVSKQDLADKALDTPTELEALTQVVPGASRMDAAGAKAAKPGPPKPRLTLPSEFLQSVELACRMLAGVCDGARSEDGCGFNKMDAEFGHSVAREGLVTDKQAKACAKMLRKYHRQLPEDLLARIKAGPEKKAEESEKAEEERPSAGSGPRQLEMF